MRSHFFFVAGAFALVLAACGKPAAIESAGALNPERLKELQAECRVDRARVSEAQCIAVADAVRKRFMRPIPSPYVNDPVQPRTAP